MTARELGDHAQKRTNFRKSEMFNKEEFRALRLDWSAGHFQERANSQSQCAYPGCDKRPSFVCRLCKVRLCPVPCMLHWHARTMLDSDSAVEEEED